MKSGVAGSFLSKKLRQCLTALIAQTFFPVLPIVSFIPLRKGSVFEHLKFTIILSGDTKDGSKAISPLPRCISSLNSRFTVNSLVLNKPKNAMHIAAQIIELSRFRTEKGVQQVVKHFHMLLQDGEANFSFDSSQDILQSYEFMKL